VVELAIDIHSHFVPPACLDELRRLDARAAPRLEGDAAAGQGFLQGVAQRVGPFGPGMYDIEARIREHDRRRVTVQALSVPPPMFHYTLEPRLAVSFARVINDALGETVRAYAERTVGLATLPLQDGAAATAELERSMAAGFRGIEIGTNVNGRNLDDPSLESVWAAAERLGAFIFVHPENVAAADRLAHYYLRNFIGNPLDTTIAVASLVFGGVLARYPNLKVCFAHAGGFAPYQVGRFDHGWGKRQEPRVRLTSEPPSTYVRKLYWDTILHNPDALGYVVQHFGAEHVLLGSDFPFDMGPDDPVADVEAVATLNDEQRRAILGKTAAQLLGVARG